MKRSTGITVLSIMTEKPLTIGRNATVRQALDAMTSIRVNHLPVIDSENHLIGILSDRDVRRVLSSEKVAPLDQVRVHEVMTAGPIVTEPSAPAVKAARLMLANNISSLPVMRSETLVGIVTKSDILVAFMRDQEQVARNSDLVSMNLSQNLAAQ